MPLGAALGGLVGELFGLTAVFWASAAVSAVFVPLLLWGVGDAGASLPPSTARPGPADQSAGAPADPAPTIAGRRVEIEP